MCGGKPLASTLSFLKAGKLPGGSHLLALMQSLAGWHLMCSSTTSLMPSVLLNGCTSGGPAWPCLSSLMMIHLKQRTYLARLSLWPLGCGRPAPLPGSHLRLQHARTGHHCTCKSMGQDHIPTAMPAARPPAKVRPVSSRLCLAWSEWTICAFLYGGMSSRPSHSPPDSPGD